MLYAVKFYKFNLLKTGAILLYPNAFHFLLYRLWFKIATWYNKIMVTLSLHGKYNEVAVADFLAKAPEADARIREDLMSGWLNLPQEITQEEIENVNRVAREIQETSRYLVCIGIGGSYLGHRAVIEALGNPSNTKVLFAGNDLSTLRLRQIFDEIGDADFSVNVISKSGSTLEPAVAFRVFKQKLIEKYGEEAALKRIYVTTDSTIGVLRQGINTYSYTSFIIPEAVGGRYSVLAAGLLPIAVAGLNVAALIDGAQQEMQNQPEIFRYAAFRAALASNNYDVEVLTTFEPELRYFTAWWQQLFGESEGKNGQGIFPATMIGTTDLHSLGQFLQQGRRNIYETFLNITKSYEELNNTRPDEQKVESVRIPELPPDIDKLNYLAGRSLGYINVQAYHATLKAHAQTIPVAELKIHQLDEQNLGALLYFFEYACAISATLQGVNPFDQPGVEAYKQEMFRLLGRDMV